MKNVLLLLISLSLLPMLAFATEKNASNIETEYNKKVGIYLCTKDLDSKHSWSSSSGQPGNYEYIGGKSCVEPKELYESVKNDDVLISYKGLDNKCHARFRHCFMVKARYLYNEALAYYSDKEAFNLEFQDSRGFGSDYKGRAVTFAEDIFEGEEPQYKELHISCELIFSEDQLTNDYLSIYNNNANKAMHHKWADLVSIMDDEVKNGYTTLDHNCCTVAEKAAKEINGNVDIDHLYDVNYGIGTRFVGILGASNAFLSSGSASNGSSKENEDTNLEGMVLEIDFDSAPEREL